MRKQAVALGLVGALAISAVPAALHAQTTPILAQGQGLVKGVATDAAKNPMKVTMQLRDANNNIVSALGTNDAGSFAIAADPGKYTLVMVDSAGNVIGSSAAITVTAGATLTVNVAASALLASGAGVAGAAGAAAAGGGVATGTSLATIALATGLGAAAITIGVVVATASPSR